jgi:hypothetical protein
MCSAAGPLPGTNIDETPYRRSSGFSSAGEKELLEIVSTIARIKDFRAIVLSN